MRWVTQELCIRQPWENDASLRWWQECLKYDNNWYWDSHKHSRILLLTCHIFVHLLYWDHFSWQKLTSDENYNTALGKWCFIGVVIRVLLGRRLLISALIELESYIYTCNSKIITCYLFVINILSVNTFMLNFGMSHSVLPPILFSWIK